jgi:hypothetical protein
MPQGDRTGPMGQGPRTGRALGFCSGYDTPGYAKGFAGGMGRSFGFGMLRGRGMGYGRGHNFDWPAGRFHQGFAWPQTINKDDEIKLLKSQAESIKRTQKDLEKRLSELEKEDE